MSLTYTGSATRATTFSDIIKVTRKVQADFLAILDTYGYFSEDVARSVVKDIRVFLDEEVIDQMSFTWRKPGSNTVMEELRYRVVSGTALRVDDPSGGIGYRLDLTDADFEVRIHHSRRWSDIGRRGREQIQEDLECPWGFADELDYEGGSSASDRIYSSGTFGMSRSRFTR
jgi:hypothetical protein